MLQLTKYIRGIGAVVKRGTLQHRYKVTTQTAAAAVKPFYYQDILQPEKPLDTPWKKLSSTLSYKRKPSTLVL